MSDDAANSFARDLIAKHRVIVAVGSGGVGKTTTSAALATLGAKMGRKVALISIDPAKRLADAMGISLGSTFSKVEFPENLEVSGSVFGAMLDQKAVFDEMVQKWAKSDKVREKIYANSIYQAVSENLGGPLEYMALAKLHAISEDSTFDLIIVDTPPDTHALDFLDRPNALAGFMERGVMTWLIKPFHIAQKLGAGRIIRAGGKMMSGIAAVTGVKMLQMLAEFLILIEDVIKGFSESGKEVVKLLHQKDTSFALVTTAQNSSLRSTKMLAQELQAKNFSLGAVFINRCFPEELLKHIETALNQSSDDTRYSHHDLEILAKKGYSIEANVKSLGPILHAHGFGDVPVGKVSERKENIHTLESLARFADDL